MLNELQQLEHDLERSLIPRYRRTQEERGRLRESLHPTAGGESRFARKRGILAGAAIALLAGVGIYLSTVSLPPPTITAYT